MAAWKLMRYRHRRHLRGAGFTRVSGYENRHVWWETWERSDRRVLLRLATFTPKQPANHPRIEACVLVHETGNLSLYYDEPQRLHWSLTRPAAWTT